MTSDMMITMMHIVYRVRGPASKTKTPCSNYQINTEQISILIAFLESKPWPRLQKQYLLVPSN